MPSKKKNPAGAKDTPIARMGSSKRMFWTKARTIRRCVRVQAGIRRYVDASKHNQSHLRETPFVPAPHPEADDLLPGLPPCCSWRVADSVLKKKRFPLLKQSMLFLLHLFCQAACALIGVPSQLFAVLILARGRFLSQRILQQPVALGVRSPAENALLASGRRKKAPLPIRRSKGLILAILRLSGPLKSQKKKSNGVLYNTGNKGVVWGRSSCRRLAGPVSKRFGTHPRR